MADSANKTNIKINLDAVKSIANVGLHRAYIFLGFAINAARDPKQYKYELPHKSGIIIVPQTKDKKEIKTAKKEFERWVIGNALRELFESASLYLDEIYNVLLIASVAKGIITPKTRTAKSKIFHEKGLHGKLTLLNKEYKISSKLSSHMKSINYARNALTHNRGVVRSRDCNKPGKLTIKWRTIRHQHKRADGTSQAITEANIPFTVEAGEKIIMKISDRQRSFNVGNHINLEPKDLHGLCLTFFIANDKIFEGLISALKKMGIPIDGKVS